MMNFPIRICLVALFCGLTACGGGGGEGRDDIVVDPVLKVKASTDQLKLRQFQGCDGYRQFIGEAITNDLLVPDVYYWLLPLPAEIAAPAAPGDGLDGQPDMVSTTNLIEEGVDEADLVKTDPQGNLFVASGRFLVVADGFPPTSINTVTEFELVEEGTAQRLLIDNVAGRAVVVVDNTPDPMADIVDPAGYLAPGTTLVFVDIADVATPSITARLWLENTGEERLIDGRVHLMSRDYVSYPDAIYTNEEIPVLRASYSEALANGNEAAAEQLHSELNSLVAGIVAATPIEHFLPRARIAGADNLFSNLTIADCASIISPALNVRLGLTTVLSLDIDGTNIGALTALTTAFDTPYVSASNFYLQQTSDNWWLNTDQAEQTAIHKIAIGSGAPEYRGMGLVDGVAQNPFQFSEHDGFLRVFTSERRFVDGGVWIPAQTNHLFVLGDDGAGTLRVTGSVRDVAPNEQIFAARFLGDRGFLVTFERIDPLFAFDLRDPHAPVLAGELEIPGFSNYIHP